MVKEMLPLVQAARRDESWVCRPQSQWCLKQPPSGSTEGDNQSPASNNKEHPTDLVLTQDTKLPSRLGLSHA